MRRINYFCFWIVLLVCLLSQICLTVYGKGDIAAVLFFPSLGICLLVLSLARFNSVPNTVVKATLVAKNAFSSGYYSRYVHYCLTFQIDGSGVRETFDVPQHIFCAVDLYSTGILTYREKGFKTYFVSFNQ